MPRFNKKQFAKIASPNPSQDTLMLARNVSMLPDVIIKIIMDMAVGHKFRRYDNVLKQIKWCFKYPENAAEMVRKYHKSYTGQEVIDGEIYDLDKRMWDGERWMNPSNHTEKFWVNRCKIYWNEKKFGYYRMHVGWHAQYRNLWCHYCEGTTIKIKTHVAIGKKTEHKLINKNFVPCPVVQSIDVLDVWKCKYSVDKLRENCKINKVPRYYKLNKKELIAALIKIP